MTDSLVDALAKLSSRGKDAVGQSVVLRTGTVIANRAGSPDSNLIGIRVGAASGGDPDDVATTMDYYDMPTLTLVSTGDVVYWLQTTNGFGLVLCKKR